MEVESSMSSSGDRTERYFFVHIMKVGGWSFNIMMRRSFAIEECYPNKKDDSNRFRAKLNVDYFRNLSPERLARIRYYGPHFPFIASELIKPAPFRLALFRDPVERVLSQIKQNRRGYPPSSSLADVYHSWPKDDGRLSNHQTQVMGAKSLREFSHVYRRLDVGQTHLDRAKENVDKLDFLGLTERFDESVRILEDSFGLNLGETVFHNVGDSSDVDENLRNSIYEHNQLDIELYEYVKMSFENRKRQITENGKHMNEPTAAGADPPIPYAGPPG
ncbi:MAG: hypothetical protein BMS9Abin05_2734 [Rhodothermia bacterium]|nr:MAG: hypothetical protein BMS9Abin05_2734 [Rhodothermia bacterium]